MTDSVTSDGLTTFIEKKLGTLHILGLPEVEQMSSFVDISSTYSRNGFVQCSALLCVSFRLRFLKLMVVDDVKAHHPMVSKWDY